MRGENSNALWCDRHEEAVNEVAGAEAGAHRSESLEIPEEVRAALGGESPEGFVLDDVQA